MKFLHTSDWHLGRRLYGTNCHAIHEAFLNWLVECVKAEGIGALIVSGDIFDNSAPSASAQNLYYGFLAALVKTECKNVVIIGGNHDSGAVLDASKEILRLLNVIVVGSASSNPEDEVFVLKDGGGCTAAIVCAVPYLRERDLSQAAVQEDFENRDERLIESLREHYQRVFCHAEAIRSELGRNTPIIAMGHLMAFGGKTSEDDGVRDLYIGGLSGVKANLFADFIDYTALGHLHTPQAVSGSEKIQYSGSPFALGFGEAKQQKSVVVFEFENRILKLKRVPIPVFQKLYEIKGNVEGIVGKINELKINDTGAWLKIECTDYAAPSILKEAVDKALEGSKMRCLLLRNYELRQNIGPENGEQIELAKISSVEDVFKMYLEHNSIGAEEQQELISVYRIALKLYYEQESNE